MADEETPVPAPETEAPAPEAPAPEAPAVEEQAPAADLSKVDVTPEGTPVDPKSISGNPEGFKSWEDIAQGRP